MRTGEFCSLLYRGLKYSALGGNIAYLSMLRRPRKALSYLATNIFYHQLASGKGLPQRSTYELFDADRGRVQEIMVGGQGWLDHWQSFVGLDLINLCLITKMVAPRCVFEIGTFDGTSALHFALNSPPDCRVFTLDLPSQASNSAAALPTTCTDRELILERRRRRVVFEESPVAGKITRLYGDSAQFDFRPYFGKLDIFFVDGAHSYEYVKSDTENAQKCCRKGGVILWHDYRPGSYGVQPYLEKLATTIPVYRLPGSSLALHITQ